MDATLMKKADELAEEFAGQATTLEELNEDASADEDGVGKDAHYGTRLASGAGVFYGDSAAR